MKKKEKKRKTKKHNKIMCINTMCVCVCIFYTQSPYGVHTPTECFNGDKLRYTL